MPQLDYRKKPTEEVRFLLGRHKGLLPVEMHCESHEITWVDFGDMHLRETFLEISAEELLQSKPDTLTIITDPDVLEQLDLYADSLSPSGFIYQIGRCGSTLLAKVLSKLKRHIVIKEAPLVEQVLGVEFERLFMAARPAFFQSLLNIYGHRRLPEHDRFFMKLSSNHVKRLGMIRGLYPDVPWLFLYRNPLETIPTSLDGPAWNVRNKNTPEGSFESALPIEKVRQLSDVDFSVQVEASSFRIVLENTCDDCLFVDYTQLRPEIIPDILRFFNVDVTEEELVEMIEPFGFYSKSDAESVPFESDSEHKRSKVTDEIRRAIDVELWDLYLALQESTRNISQVYGTP